MLETTSGRENVETPVAAAIVLQRGRETVRIEPWGRNSVRVRVSLGPAVPGAAGKSIVLAPTVDDQQRVQWMCVPIDIPPRYLPEACRR